VVICGLIIVAVITIIVVDHYAQKQGRRE